jgi:predicted DNA-binding transcriptional regulator YafY
MLQTSARLLRLLSLLQSRRFWSGAELAERLQVTERTVRRDVDRLRELGYPVSATSGPAGGYQLGAGATLPPLLLDDDEALAVSLGLRTAAAGTVTGLEEAALRALSKLEPLLPARLRRRVKALHGAIVPMHLAGPRVDSELLAALAQASRGSERVRMQYADRSGRPSERNLEPLGLVHTGSRWYLVAWDLDREDFRTFRVDRATQARPTGVRFSPREVPGGDLAAFVSKNVSAEAYAYRARVILHAPAEKIQQRVPPTAGRVERLDDARCLLVTGGNSLAMLGFYIATLGAEFEVLEPEDLVQELDAVAARIARAVRTIERAD